MTDKVKNVVITITFLFVIIIIMLLNFIKKDEEISLTERRKLALFPEFSVSKLIDGSFIKKIENYTMDQFIKRDEFRKLKVVIEQKVLGRNDSNQIYKYNDSLIKQEYPLNEKSVMNLTKKINQIKNMYLNETNNIYYSIVPDKNYYTDEQKYLKMDYSKIEQIMQENLIDMEYIDIFDILKLEDYYYTDTHWKQEKLQKVLDKIGSKMNFKDRLKTNFEERKITNFKGVYSGQLPLETKEDIIKILTNNIIETSKVYNYETNKETKIYDLEKINSIDKYDIYLSGATPLLKITNTSAKTEKELVVFRDSFGSSIIPLFTEAYKTITVVDTRYISSSLLKEYVEFENKDVLFIYSTLIVNNSSTLK